MVTVSFFKKGDDLINVVLVFLLVCLMVPGSSNDHELGVNGREVQIVGRVGAVSGSGGRTLLASWGLERGWVASLGGGGRGGGGGGSGGGCGGRGTQEETGHGAEEAGHDGVVLLFCQEWSVQEGCFSTVDVKNFVFQPVTLPSILLTCKTEDCHSSFYFLIANGIQWGRWWWW